MSNLKTKLAFKPGDRVRHSQEFMREFARFWHMRPGSDEYEFVAQAEGRIMLALRHGQYMVDWQHQHDVDEDARETIWHRSDMEPA